MIIINEPKAEPQATIINLSKNVIEVLVGVLVAVLITVLVASQLIDNETVVTPNE